MIPYGKQDISQQDIDGVVEVLKSDFLTQGPKVPQFEEALMLNIAHQYQQTTDWHNAVPKGIL